MERRARSGALEQGVAGAELPALHRAVPVQLRLAPLPETAKPGVQVHEDAPAELVLPDGHAVHELEPGRLYVPAGQTVWRPPLRACVRPMHEREPFGHAPFGKEIAYWSMQRSCRRGRCPRSRRGRCRWRRRTC